MSDKDVAPSDELDEDGSVEQQETPVEPVDQEGGDSGDGEDNVEALQAQLEALQEKVAEADDKVLRTVAEMQNIRRRSENEVSNARKFALEKFSTALLDVADNLERALSLVDSDSEATKALYDGVELTRKGFIDTLAKFSVDQVDPLGEPFDPELHQAMTMVENADSEPNTVLDVMQKGYTLSGRLLRPAMVVVSKAS